MAKYVSRRHPFWTRETSPRFVPQAPIRAPQIRLASNNIGWGRTEWNRVFRYLWGHRRPLVTGSNMAEYENGRSTSSRDALYRRVLLFVCTVSHIPPYVFLSREDDDDVRDFGKHDFFRSVLLRAMLSNANSLTTPVMQVKSSQKTSSGLGNITCALFAVHLLDSRLQQLILLIG